MYNDEGSFARKQLEKYGWTNGSGLGSSQQGISQPIRAKIKNNTTGMGHDPAKEFTNFWWEDLYNKAAASLVVEKTKDGVRVTSKTALKGRAETLKKGPYANFIKSSLLSNGTETKVEKESEDLDSSDNEPSTTTPTPRLTNDMFLGYIGLPYRMKTNGKLERIAAQDRLWAENRKKSSSGVPSSSTSQPSGNKATNPAPGAGEELPAAERRKKSRKRKHEELEDEHAECSGKSRECTGDEVDDTSDRSEGDASVSKKKKKKKRKKERAENDDVEKSGREETEANKGENSGVVMDMASFPVLEENVSEVKKRKKKSKSTDVLSDSCSDLPEREDASERKKEKKKRKTESVNACGDSCSDMQTDDKCGRTLSDTAAAYVSVTGSQCATDDELKNRTGCTGNEDDDMPDQSECAASVSKKKKKKKNKERAETEDREKKKRKQETEEKSEDNNVVTETTLLYPVSEENAYEIKKQKKESKTKSTNVLSDSCSDLPQREGDSEGKNEKKKKKPKTESADAHSDGCSDLQTDSKREDTVSNSAPASFNYADSQCAADEEARDSRKKSKKKKKCKRAES